MTELSREREERAPASTAAACAEAASTDSVVDEAIARAYRGEWARVVAALTRRFGDLDAAEDAVAEAFATAIERWPRDGVPPNPGAWLTTTATRKAIDRIRRESRRDELHQEAQMLFNDEPPEPLGAIDDDRLRLIFTCCHPRTESTRSAGRGRFRRGRVVDGWYGRRGRGRGGRVGGRGRGYVDGRHGRRGLRRRGRRGRGFDRRGRRGRAGACGRPIRGRHRGGRYRRGHGAPQRAGRASWAGVVVGRGSLGGVVPNGAGSARRGGHSAGILGRGVDPAWLGVRRARGVHGARRAGGVDAVERESRRDAAGRARRNARDPGRQ